VYLFGLLFTDNLYAIAPIPSFLPSFHPSLTKPNTPGLKSVLIFILTMLLLSMDFYHLKNIAGRRLVGLRWWNEVNPSTGSTTMVFESLDLAAASSTSTQQRRLPNATDKRFFWLALYVQPLLWVALAVVAIVKFEFVWLTLVGIALVLTLTNTVAFSRCDKFGQASSLASGAMGSSGFAGGVARGLASSVVGRLFK